MAEQTALDWVGRHDTRAPAELRERMRDMLTRAGAGTPLTDALIDAAVDCLRRALWRSGDRAGAMDLLAADALLTFACEAAVDDGPDSLAELPERVSRCLAPLLPEAGS